MDTSNQEKPKYERVREALIAYIREADLLPRDRLPSERQLAETMGCNRLTVRHAIKTLCDEGLVCQVPKTGTFLVRRPDASADGGNLLQEPPGEAASFLAEDSFFAPAATAELRLHLEDILPEQRLVWDRIFREFERRHPGCSVRACYQNGRQLLMDEEHSFDAALAIPSHLQRLLATGRLAEETFAPSWGMEHPLGDEWRMHHKLLLETFAAPGGGLHGVPILYNFSVLFCNRKRCREGLVDQPTPEELLQWIKTAPRDGALCCPFAQSSLNLLMRQDELVSPLEATTVDLDLPACRRWIEVERECFQLYPELAETRPDSLVTGFLEGSVAQCDLHSNAIRLLGERFADGLSSLSAHLQVMQPTGRTQVMPRYLVSLRERSANPLVLVLANFLAGRWAQLELARHQIGLPFYLGQEGIEAFCNGGPLTAEQVTRELACLGGIYERPWFREPFQFRVLTPLLRLYCSGGITFEQLVHQVRQHTTG